MKLFPDYSLFFLNSVVCPSGCSACTSLTECTDCLDGYFLEDQSCVGKNTILLQYDSAKYTNNITEYQKLIYCLYLLLLFLKNKFYLPVHNSVIYIYHIGLYYSMLLFSISLELHVTLKGNFYILFLSHNAQLVLYCLCIN